MGKKQKLDQPGCCRASSRRRWRVGAAPAMEVVDESRAARRSASVPSPAAYGPAAPTGINMSQLGTMSVTVTS